MGTGWQGCADSAFGCKPQGTISITVDGGKTWNVLLRTPRAVVSVTIDGARERAVFDDGETIGSSDGGLHWAPVVVRPPIGEGSPCPVGSQAFVVVDWTVCGSQSSAGSQAKSVYRLRPHGWRRVPARGLSEYGYVAGLAVARDGFGIVWESRGTLYVTRNGGSSWTGLRNVAAPEVDFGASAVALTHGVGFALLSHEAQKCAGSSRRLTPAAAGASSMRGSSYARLM